MTRLMTTALLLSTLMFSSASFARKIPNCFTRPNVNEGEFLIYVDTEKVTKEDLIEVQSRANGQYISVQSYPFMLGDSMIISVQAIDYVYDDKRLTRRDLKKAAVEELSELQNIPAVSISCNGLKRLPGQ